MDESNPYRSPTDPSRGEYDWTLAKRAFLAVALLACWYLLISAVGWWQVFSRDPNIAQLATVDALVQFATDWRTNVQPR